jgi:cytochrome b
MAGLFLLIIAVVFATYAAGPHGLWWQWLGVALPAVIVIRMLIRAWQLGSRDSARLRELDRLQQEWQGRLDRGEIPRPRAGAQGTTS